MTLDGRMETRVPIVMPIYLLDARRTAQAPELALTENVSPNGVRVITKWKRQPGEQEHFALLSGEEALRAEVVYCLQTPKNAYCVGLRLQRPRAGWWHAQTRPARVGVAARWAAMLREGFMPGSRNGTR